MPSITTQYSHDILAGASDYCSNHQVELTILVSDNDPVKEDRLLSSAPLSGAKGIILFPVDQDNTYDNELLKLCIRIKANANTKKVVQKEVPVAAKRYAKELMKEVYADREGHGKKPFENDSDDDNSNEPPAPAKKKRDNTSKKKLKKRKKEAKKTVTVSTTDPDCGLFVKGDHKKQLSYEAHTACDVHGVVLAVEVTPGNVHDSVAFDDVYDKVVEQFPDVHAFVADSAYKTPHICKKVFSDDRV